MSELSRSGPSIFGMFFNHVVCMPTWHRGVLLLATFLAGVGVAGHVRQYNANATGNPPSSPTVNAPHSGFASDNTPAATSTDTGATSQQPWYLSPKALNIGGSVLGGFLIGWLARAFLKTVAGIAFLGGGALFALSYFHVINVDLSSANQQYTSAMHWLTDQMSRLKDVAIGYLPIHAAGAFGTFLGFQRR